MELKSREALKDTETAFPLEERIEGFEELVHWFHHFCVPEEECKVGIEVERLGVRGGTGEAVPYSGRQGLEMVLNEFEQSLGWEAVREGDHIIRLCNHGCQINLEPGGQFEVSGSPFDDLHAVLDEQRSVTRAMRNLSNGEDIAWIGIGMQPFSELDEIEWVPKGRYRILAKYLGGTGTLGHLMMKQTASIQVSFNYQSEEDALFKMRLATALSPISTAIFANSPISDGALNGYLSKRAHIWAHTDPSRCGLVTQILEDDSGFADYVEYALSAPMLFIVREGKWIKMDPIPFSRYMEMGGGDYQATYGDWDLHLTTLFPEVRMKRIVEVRCADNQRPEMMMTIPAFWKGLLYDPQTSEDAWGLVAKIPREGLERLMAEVPVKGLDAFTGERSVRELAGDLLRLSRNGLIRQGKGEEELLEPIEEYILERGITPAEDVIQRWEAGWKEDPNGLIKFHRF
jgi:glutamate--cysteine ligase